MSIGIEVKVTDHHMTFIGDVRGDPGILPALLLLKMKPHEYLPEDGLR
jgi:hypothetical protein